MHRGQNLHTSCVVTTGIGEGSGSGAVIRFRAFFASSSALRDFSIEEELLLSLDFFSGVGGVILLRTTFSVFTCEGFLISEDLTTEGGDVLDFSCFSTFGGEGFLVSSAATCFIGAMMAAGLLFILIWPLSS